MLVWSQCGSIIENGKFCSGSVKLLLKYWLQKFATQDDFMKGITMQEIDTLLHLDTHTYHTNEKRCARIQFEITHTDITVEYYYGGILGS